MTRSFLGPMRAFHANLPETCRPTQSLRPSRTMASCGCSTATARCSGAPRKSLKGHRLLLCVGVAELILGRCSHQTLGLTNLTPRRIRAAPDGAGGFVSPPVDAGFVGGGRTLGQHFDAAGNLIFCHAATVRTSLRPSVYRPHICAQCSSTRL